MIPTIRILLSYVGAIGIVIIAMFFMANLYSSISLPSENTYVRESRDFPRQDEVSDTLDLATSTPEIVEEDVSLTSDREESSTPITPDPPLTTISEETETLSPGITRIQNPYTFPPYSFDVINTEARTAVVNIQCSGSINGPRSITGSGIFIDSRGVILTNAHVAQYVLLSQSSDISLSCAILHGSPARTLWTAEILHISSDWIREHSEDITKKHTTGTGEYDYALLRVTGMLDSSPLPETFPALPLDTRAQIGFLGDTVLVASYPAEFVIGTSQTTLYPVTSIAVIQELLTFDTGSVDLFSVGGTAGAQGGSSGGGVVNAWGHLIGIITTTSEGDTTAERDLRAIALSYIDADLISKTGETLATFLSGDIVSKAIDFNTNEAPTLIDLLLEQINS